jgi:hypothetical protein
MISIRLSPDFERMMHAVGKLTGQSTTTLLKRSVLNTALYFVRAARETGLLSDERARELVRDVGETTEFERICYGLALTLEAVYAERPDFAMVLQVGETLPAGAADAARRSFEVTQAAGRIMPGDIPPPATSDQSELSPNAKITRSGTAEESPLAPVEPEKVSAGE